MQLLLASSFGTNNSAYCIIFNVLFFSVPNANHLFNHMDCEQDMEDLVLLLPQEWAAAPCFVTPLLWQAQIYPILSFLAHLYKDGAHA